MRKVLLLSALSLLIYHLLPNPSLCMRLNNNGIIRLPTTTTTDDMIPVLDSDGDVVKPYFQYSLHPPQGKYGGVRLSGNTLPCPIDIILSSSSDPIAVIPKDPTATSVFQSAYVSFKFAIPTSPTCLHRMYWDSEHYQFGYLVQAGNTISDNFKIEPVSLDNHNYKITYCVSSSDCFEIGTYQSPDDGTTRLAVTGKSHLNPFIFKFEKGNALPTYE